MLKIIMTRKKIYIVLILIFVLAFFAGNLVYPDFYNKTLGKIGFPRFPEKPFKLGLDLQGGIHLVYEADLSAVEKKNYSYVMQGLRDIIEKRINYYGIQEPIIQVQEGTDRNRLIVELAGVKNPDEAIKLIGQTPFLEFKQERKAEDTQIILDKQKEIKDKSLEEVQKIKDWQVALQDPYFESTELTGKYLKNAEISFDQTTLKPLILLQFSKEGAKIFEDLTTINVGKRLAIYIDNNLLSAPNVNEKISGGKAQITGDFTVKEAQDLVKNLNAGALPVPIKLISQQLVGPTLGAISLKQSLNAGIYGFLAVLAFMIIVYRLPGLLSAVALTIYMFLVLAVFKTIPVTLTLSGIGGFILSIGIAVDANVLIFARIKEELKEGKSFELALEQGFRRSWPSIRDGNLTTAIVALMFFAFGTSFIKGFALTLIIGIAISMFSAIIITRYLMRFFIGTKIERIKRLW